MNTVIENMKTRRSVRAFDPDRMPERSLIEAVAEAGTYAPTGRGAQSPLIVAVTSKAVRDRLSELNAAVMADRTRPTYLYDGSLVMGNLMNAAHALGLGSCWIHRAREVFDSEEGKAMLRAWGIEGDYEGIGHCVLGYPREGAVREAAPRKDDYVRFVE